LAKACDDLGAYAQAMMHFDAAHALLGEHVAKSGWIFDAASHATDVDRTIAFFTPAVTQAAALGSADDLPVLVVGMPRSGTTLVEQIVSSHPEIGAAGEQQFWPERSALMRGLMAGKVTPEMLRQAGDDYCALLRTL